MQRLPRALHNYEGPLVTFQGTIPNPLRSIIKEAAHDWPVGDIYVACAGNMTIERTLFDANPAFVPRSNDVSIYTYALGTWLAGDPVKMGVADDWEEEWG